MPERYSMCSCQAITGGALVAPSAGCPVHPEAAWRQRALAAEAALASCEAEVRRKVAREIDKEAEKCLTARDKLPLSNPRGETHERQAGAYRHAARIARGES
jgi:hypothetical protein